MRAVKRYRIEKDSMDLSCPRGGYYGAQTQRAADNFPISGFRFPREFLYTLGLIKYAAAKVNRDLDVCLRKAGAIQKASSR